MSNFTRASYHPREKVVRAANWLDDYFGLHQHGVSFPDDPHVYRPWETDIPLDVVFVPRGSVASDRSERHGAKETDV